MDILTPIQRHKAMASNHSKNTKPEIIVRKYLWRCGFRYRSNNPRLPGHPDIVLRKYRTCIFVNGCFWHGHSCSIAHQTKSNTDFWRAKIQRNKDRDEKNNQKLKDMGWNVLEVWECELMHDPELRLIRLLGEICGEDYS